MVKKTKDKDTAIVVNNLVIRPANRGIVDIKNWRNALTSAERGRRTTLYDLYDDILLDNFLDESIQKRVEAITNADLVFINEKGESVLEIDSMIDSTGFEELLTEILSAKFWGCSLTQIDFTSDKRLLTYAIPKKHIRPVEKTIAFDQNDDTGYPFEQDDRFLFAGNDKNLGLILKACPYVIYKRGGFGDWAQFAEVFGMPFRKATYDTYDENTRVLLEKAMEAAGSAQYAVIPKGSDFDIIDSKSQGNGQIYKLLRDACNEEILIGILGQSMTTTNGASRSQSETHMEVQENKHKSDRRFVQRILNEKLLPILIKRGFKAQGGWFSFPEKGESISLKDRITIDNQLNNLIAIPEDYFYETYGIPKPKKSEKGAKSDSDEGSEKETSSDKDKKLINRINDFFVRALQNRGADLDF